MYDFIKYSSKEQQSNIFIKFFATIYTPWVFKPVYALISDTFPIKGYKFTPFIILSTILQLTCCAVLGFMEYPPLERVTFLSVMTMVCVAINDTLAEGLMGLVTKMDIKLNYTNIEDGLKRDGTSMRFIGHYVIMRFIFDAFFRYLGSVLLYFRRPCQTAFQILTVCSLFTLVGVFYLFKEREVSDLIILD